MSSRRSGSSTAGSRPARATRPAMPAGAARWTGPRAGPKLLRLGELLSHAIVLEVRPACGAPASTPSPSPAPAWPGREEAAGDDPFAGLNAERGYDPVSRYMTDKPLVIHDDPDEDEQEPDKRPGRRRRRIGMTAAGVVIAVAAGAVAGWTALHHHS